MPFYQARTQDLLSGRSVYPGLLFPWLTEPHTFLLGSLWHVHLPKAPQLPGPPNYQASSIRGVEKENWQGAGVGISQEPQAPCLSFLGCSNPTLGGWNWTFIRDKPQ